jgi:alkanesulfonate monooxygenase SsuD/methylene tetrahydromethanopterin reductase-like flavin-dependent oxidoreductase (luciferase family)
LVTGRDEAAKRLAAEAWRTVVTLWRLLQPKLDREPAVREAFRDAAADPQDPDVQAALRVQVRKLLTTDGELAQQVDAILDAPGQDGKLAAQRLLELAGSGLWEGDLAEMRDDLSSSRSS